ncbi:MAG: SusC/RagA family TonB-linked outer membrane protein [Dysgonamonadaceae bacterium]|jgi:TonB-linked SusC/RagA family outer membrane protein|nr:SusC/RagA family TonB-linked outer membrane protein [Dysgonamonadaceae bacterium]
MNKNLTINWNMLLKTILTVSIFISTLSLFAQGGVTVTGVITDETGITVPNVSVTLKGATLGVLSNADGKYSISVPGNNAVLVFSYLGFATQEITVGSQTVINITLEEEATEIGEVVVTGMGITKDIRKLGYAVSTISAKELTKVGTSNFGTALYGKASGVRITAPPGGSAGGVSINIRGLNSINGNNQPMIFMNGVPIRNGNSDDTYSTFGDSPGIRSNGLVDINPEDIETLTILKGAAATALYGSEAANGVVMITSKKAKGTGISVDVNVTLEVNTLAYLPKIQNEYGPGSYTLQLDDYNLNNGRFAETTYNGQRYEIPRWTAGVTHVWGPKYDGRSVLYWDGKTRPYSSISDDPWRDLFRTGSNQIYNFAINQGGANSNTRFSYTYLDEVPNGLAGSYNKHNFNLIGNIKVNKRITLDYSGNYIIQNFHNRASGTTGSMDSFSNLFSTFTDIDLLKKMYKTSLGYKNYHSGDASLTPNESFAMDIQQINWIRDHLWDINMNNNYETNSRFIGSVAPQWQIADFLTLRGRVSSDLSADKIERKNSTERPLVLYDPSGGYRITHKNYSVYHGDIMLMFDKNLTDKINLAANIGWQGRSEEMGLLSSWADGGLTTENTFLLTASRNNVRTEQNRMQLLKTAVMGSIDFSFDDYLFLGVTGRQEKSSTLPKGSNTYFYPSANASFLYTSAFDDLLPKWYNYGKLRFSYGIVGNAPAPYAANIVYDAGSGGGASWSTIPGTMGNEALMPEKITEMEIGLENKFFNNRLGFEVSLYSRRISDMIVQQPVPVSDGVSNMWMNVGEMLNKGVEVSLNFTPVETRDYRWEVHSNLAFNSNEITQLAPGIDYLRNNASTGNSGGGVAVRSYVGRPMGDIYVNPLRTVEDPSNQYYGRNIVKVDGWETGGGGFYSTKTGEANQACIGNINPKMIGGLGTSFTYKNFFIDVMTDFRIGGDVMNTAEQFPTARGVSTISLANRDASHGGLAYQYKGHTLDNGMIIPGVVEIKDNNGNVTGYAENTTVTPADLYHNMTYNWGNSEEGITSWFSVHENSYWKLRELVLGYNLPGSIIQKVGLKNMRISVFGRNLGYLYKTLKEIDPESTNGGTSWGGQAGVGYSSSPTRTFGLSLRLSF